MNALKKIGAISAAAVAAPAFAVGPSAGDLSALTPDLSTVLTAVGAVAAAMIGLALAVKGFRVVQSMLSQNRG